MLEEFRGRENIWKGRELGVLKICKNKRVGKTKNSERQEAIVTELNDLI